MKLYSKVMQFFNKHLTSRFALAKLRKQNPKMAAVIEHVKSNNLTYLDTKALIELQNAVLQVETNHVPGSLIEAGCALGGSAIVITAAKDQERPLEVYDTFGTIPPPSENDEDDSKVRYDEIAKGEAQGLGGDKYYGYVENLLDKVKGFFEIAKYPSDAHKVVFIPGLYETSLYPNGPVALAHIDCDWYDSVMVCLERIEPNLSPGGILVIDDYYHWSGCRKAVNEYFADRMQAYVFRHGARLQVHKR